MRAAPASPPRLLHYAMTRDALELLDTAGVRTFTDLAGWDAQPLQHHLACVNARALRVGDAPPVAAVAAWIAHARRSTGAADRQVRPAARFPRLRRLYDHLTPR